MTAPSAWSRNIKLGAALLAFRVFFLSYTAMCAGIAQVMCLLR